MRLAETSVSSDQSRVCDWSILCRDIREKVLTRNFHFPPGFLLRMGFLLRWVKQVLSTFKRKMNSSKHVDNWWIPKILIASCYTESSVSGRETKIFLKSHKGLDEVSNRSKSKLTEASLSVTIHRLEQAVVLKSGVILTDYQILATK